MACTIGVARCGLQRSFVRIFQVLRAALARSPMARIRACARLIFFCQAESYRGSNPLPATSCKKRPLTC